MDPQPRQEYPRFRRPSWWPENEPWPPPMRRPRHKRFMRGFGCAFVLFNLVVLGILVMVIAFIARALGLIEFTFDMTRCMIPLGMAFALFLLLIIAATGVSVRRVFIPLNDLLEAADRVAAGDYNVHVPERGPRDVRAAARAFNTMAARLSETDAQRRALLADITHELRNPLTILQGNLEGMLDGVYPPDEARLRSLLEETNLLSRLVEDLRTLSLAESGALELRREPTDLGLLANETAASFRARAEAAGLTLRVDAAGDLPPLDLDPGRMRQVLSNLLANALRYTPSGGTVAVRIQRAEGQVVLAVQDSGPGIPADHLPHVFERFYKSADSGGMGLGLAIARALVEAHGGTIRADSAPGEGTTIRIELPLFQNE